MANLGPFAQMQLAAAEMCSGVHTLSFLRRTRFLQILPPQGKKGCYFGLPQGEINIEGKNKQWEMIDLDGFCADKREFY
jgi:hypothetical protein